MCARLFLYKGKQFAEKAYHSVDQKWDKHNAENGKPISFAALAAKLPAHVDSARDLSLREPSGTICPHLVSDEKDRLSDRICRRPGGALKPYTDHDRVRYSGGAEYICRSVLHHFWVNTEEVFNETMGLFLVHVVDLCDSS